MSLKQSRRPVSAARRPPKPASNSFISKRGSLKRDNKLRPEQVKMLESVAAIEQGKFGGK